MCLTTEATCRTQGSGEGREMGVWMCVCVCVGGGGGGGGGGMKYQKVRRTQLLLHFQSTCMPRPFCRREEGLVF